MISVSSLILLIRAAAVAPSAIDWSFQKLDAPFCTHWGICSRK
ncbi:hypothetical protein [Ureibacillus manganicus]|nr:hypothetical protein [Ureibacillus manganicus]